MLYYFVATLFVGTLFVLYYFVLYYFVLYYSDKYFVATPSCCTTTSTTSVVRIFVGAVCFPPSLFTAVVCVAEEVRGRRGDRARRREEKFG